MTNNDIASIKAMCNAVEAERERDVMSAAAMAYAILTTTVPHLFDEIERLREFQKWIRITEDLPGYGEEVLVMHDGVVDIAVMDEVNVFTNLFTHWMPLPEPPKGEKWTD